MSILASGVQVSPIDGSTGNQYVESRFRRVPNVKVIRERLHLTQEQFAATFHLSIGTVRDWEQGRVLPDQAARTLLTVIAREPEAVKRALVTASRA